MIRLKVTVNGTRDLSQQLAAYGIEVVSDVRRVVNSAALEVQYIAKRRCPVRTGRLRSSIALRFYGRGAGYAAEVGTNVEYGPAVEFGARGRAGKPFLGPAWEAVRPRFERDIERAVKG